MSWWAKPTVLVESGRSQKRWGGYEGENEGPSQVREKGDSGGGLFQCSGSSRGENNNRERLERGEDGRETKGMGRTRWQVAGSSLQLKYEGGVGLARTRGPEWLRVETLPIRMVARGLGAHHKNRIRCPARVPVSGRLQSKNKRQTKIRGWHEEGKRVS